MNNTNTELDPQLEEMRQQLSTLKNKLDQQEIVNDNIMSGATKKIIDSTLYRHYIFAVIYLLFIPYAFWLSRANGFDVPTIMIMIFSVVVVAKTIRDIIKIKRQPQMNESLIEVHEQTAIEGNLALASHYGFCGMFAGAWVFHFYVVSNNTPNIADWIIMIGVVAMAVIYNSLFSNTLRQNQEIIDQIKDLKKG